MNKKLNVKRLIVIKGSAIQHVNSPGTLILPFEEVVRLAKSGNLSRFVLHFKEVLLRVRKLETLTSPFLTASVVKIMSRRYSVIEDDFGCREKITWLFIIKKLVEYCREWFDSKLFLASTAEEVERCTKEDPKKPTTQLRPDGQPVYLRTDLTYGLKAGGSIGHIAGVLNNLSRFLKPPVLLTSANIPCVDPTIETHIIQPDLRFLSFPESRYLDYNGKVIRQTKQILGSKRIAFIYQRYSLNNFAGYKLSRCYGVPFVLEYNGSEIWVGKNWGRRVKNETLSTAIENLNLRSADLVVVVSKPLKDEVGKRGVPFERVLVNPNGVNPEKYSPEIDGSKIRSDWNLIDKTVIGFIGTFGRWHGAEVLVEAFGMLLNRNPAYRDTVLLFLIGDGLMMPAVREQAKKMDLSNNIIFSGVVPQEHGPAYLAGCDILASPHVPNPDGSPFFGSPTKIFEYMAMGKGIVASNLGQIGDVLKHQETAWLTRPADVRQLMKGLEVMIERPDLRKKLGDEARAEVIRRYTWEMHTHRIINALAGFDDRN